MGIERRDGCYFIAKDRLGEGCDDGSPDWLLHIAEKGKHYDFDDFATAYLVALALHGYGDYFSPANLLDTIDRCTSMRKRTAAFNKFCDKHDPPDKDGFRCM